MRTRRRLLLAALALAIALGLAPAAGRLPLVVRPTDLDVNAHANNAKFIEYLQWGRWAWLEEAGFGRDRLVALEAVPLVVNINVNYRRPARLNDQLVVVTTPEPPAEGGKSYRFRQEVRRGDEVVADAVVTVANYSPAAGRSVPVPPELAKALGGAQ